MEKQSFIGGFYGNGHWDNIASRSSSMFGGFQNITKSQAMWVDTRWVTQVPDDQHNIEVRVAVMGSADAGKSTLLGVMTQGQLDNGRGRARLNMFRHLHEVQSGRTSSISHEILGFNSKVCVNTFVWFDILKFMIRVTLSLQTY